jgi:hypothetical protein
LAGGAAVVAVLVAGGAGPAGAEPQATMSVSPTGEGATPPTVTGSFKGSTLLVDVEKIVAVDLTVVPAGPTGGDPVNQNGCEVVSAGDCDTSEVSFSWAIGALAYNGPYVVHGAARWCDPLLCLSPRSVTADPVEFSLGAEPSAPTELRADAQGDRTVVVSWARNGEPDLQHYALFRKDPGGEFRRVGSEIAQPDSGRPTFTDTSVAATAGGDFVYRVFAVRNGASGDETTTKISRGSADRATTVVPLTTTTAVGTDPNAPPVTIAGEGVDISSFLSGQAPALDSPAPIFLDLPDTGFGDLPFGVLPGDDELEPGEEEAVLPTTSRQREIAQFNRSRPLIPVAAGAILLVLAGHIRLLNVRTKAAPEKPPPGTYVARALEAARAKQLPLGTASSNGAGSNGVHGEPATPDPARIDPVPIAPVPITRRPKAAIGAEQGRIGASHVAAAVANGGHHRVPAGDDDVAELPVWAEFEPASALGLLDALYADEDGADEEDAGADSHNDDGAAEVHRHQFEQFAPQYPSDRDLEAVPEPDDEPEAHREFDPDPEPEPTPVRRPQTARAEAPAVRLVVSEPKPVAVAPHRPEPDAESDVEAEPDVGLEELYAFDTSSKWFSEPDSEPEPEPEVLYGFDDESQWSGEPEVFVSPRR